jgi:hypothetical protein
MDQFARPLRRITMTSVADQAARHPREWVYARDRIREWVVEGAAGVERDGVPLDVASLLAITPEALDGCVLVLYAPDVAARFGEHLGSRRRRP